MTEISPQRFSQMFSSALTDPRLKMGAQPGGRMAQKEPYAHLTGGLPYARVIPNAARGVSTLAQVVRHEPVRDYDLSNLDDNAKRAGSLLIATLATLGLNRRVFGIGEFLGFASWFGAMAATPKIINALVNLKTGVNLTQEYNTSYGQREQLFKDPHYLPLHILPDAVVNRVADKLGIPANIPNRRQATEEKMRQISVQTRTWWMLVAGPATPVISGMVCDLTQDRVMDAYNKLKAAWHQNRALGALEAGDADKAIKQLSRYVEQMAGKVPESGISRWWKGFGQGIVKTTGLKDALSVGDVVNARQEEVMQKLIAHFAAMGQEGGQAALESSGAYLEHQQELLGQLEKQTTELLGKFEGRLDAAEYRRQKQFLQTRIQNARSTLTHYDDLISALKKGGVTPEQVRILLEKPVYAEAQKLMEKGVAKEAARVVGNDDVYQFCRKVGDTRQYGKAFEMLGQSPASNLLVSLKDTMLRKLWRRRVVGYLGGGLLLSTVLFNRFFLGKDLAKPKKPAGGQA